MTMLDTSRDITWYRPNQRHEIGFLRTWLIMGRNIVRARELVWQLFKRDFLAGYRKSYIGFTWIFLSPILGIVSWLILKYAGLLKAADPAELLVGTAMWGLFLGLYTASSQTLTSGASLVMQVSYPHEALLFKQVAQQVANFTLSFITIAVTLAVLKVVPSWKTVFLPLVLLPMFFLASAMGLVFSMIKVVAIDLDKAVNASIGLALFLTPVIYTTEAPHPFLQVVNRWNPLTYLICSARDILLKGRLYDAPGYFICAAGAFLAFMIAWRLFYVSEDKIVERMI